tara:strand:+ start:325 stop:1068 length:744 start_codon:yes stop_codon:yes gene_type:complete
MESKLKVFITGASSGIGSALAEEYAKQGAIIGLAARRQEKLEEIKVSCQSLGAKDVVTYNLDVTNEEESMNVAKEFISLDREGIDVVIANAGVAFSDSLSSGDPKQINQTLTINILGVTNTIVPFIPSMKKQKTGSLVIMSSIASFTAPPYFGGYAASKAAVRRLGDVWRRSLKKYNVDVTTICPGYIKSEMTDVNEFKMPFLMDTDVAARKMVKAIESGKKTYILPWQWRPIIALSRLLGQKLSKI